MPQNGYTHGAPPARFYHPPDPLRLSPSARQRGRAAARLLERGERERPDDVTLGDHEDGEDRRDPEHAPRHDDVVDGIPTAVHLCRVNKARQGWIGGATTQSCPRSAGSTRRSTCWSSTIPVADDFAVLRQLPDDRLIGRGCLDCRGETVEAPEVIATGSARPGGTWILDASSG